jgi:hypothetical protein
MDTGHWKADFDINFKSFFGFVYIITNRLCGKKYIGKKQFKFKKRNKIIDSDWKIYTGSSKELNSDIKKYGKENFDFKIVSLHSCKALLSYYETKLIFEHDALLSADYYNRFVRCRIFSKSLLGSVNIKP